MFKLIRVVGEDLISQLVVNQNTKTRTKCSLNYNLVRDSLASVMTF